MNVSIIIPTLNEAAVLEGTLAKMQNLNPDEIIVVDGGSQDETIRIAIKNGCQSIQTSPGRSVQMNAGAEKAKGDILVFLHADSFLEPDGYARMLKTLQDTNIVGGAFSLFIDSDKLSLRSIALLANFRARYFNLVYGDQAIFVRADIFKKVKGFTSIPICEDLDFFRKISLQGKTVLLKEKTFTSGRRWLKEGILCTSLRNFLIAGLFLLGFSPRILSKWYPPVR